MPNERALSESTEATNILAPTIGSFNHNGAIILEEMTNPNYAPEHIHPLDIHTDHVVAHFAQVAAINRWLIEDLATPEQLEAFFFGDQTAVHPDIQAETQKHQQLNDIFVAGVTSPESEAIQQNIRARLEEASKALEGEKPELIAAGRLAQFESLHIISDLDNTITDQTKEIRLNGISPLPASNVVDQPIARHGRSEFFNYAMAGGFGPAMKKHPEAFRKAGELAHLREGVDECFEYLKDSGVKLSIVSANFEPFVKGALSKLTQEHEYSVWAVSDESTISSTQKGAVIKHLAIENPDSGDIFVGDGTSDRPAIQVKDIIAFYFALKGSAFAKELKDASALFFEFESWHEIKDQLEEVRSLIPEAKKRLAVIDKERISDSITSNLIRDGFTIVDEDRQRPWGAFFRVSDEDAPQFIEKYFPGVDPEQAVNGLPLSPKILLVSPHEQLSWQYHDRRSEKWRVVDGRVAVVLSETNDETSPIVLQAGDYIEVPAGIRHRIIGLDSFATVAELWEHTDPQATSSEEDIHRVADLYGRS